MCVLIFSTTFVWKHFSFREELSEIWSKICIGLHVKYRLIFPDFKETWIFPADYRKNAQIRNLMKIHKVRVKLFHVDRRTDKTKMVVAFRNSANAPKKLSVW